MDGAATVGTAQALQGACHCGAAGWALTGDPGAVTSCSCTLCRRYGALWAYDYEAERITLRGAMAAYVRPDTSDPHLEVLFCPTCACLIAWRGLHAAPDGRRRAAVNVRLADPGDVAALALRRLDGLAGFREASGGARRVEDLWF